MPDCRPGSCDYVSMDCADEGLARGRSSTCIRPFGRRLRTRCARRIVEKNVAKLVRVPAPPKAERSPLTVEEVKSFLKSSRDDRLYAMFVVFAVLGMRRSEVLGLKWQDVDPVEGFLQVRRGLQRIDGELTVLPTKTLRSRRNPVASVRIAGPREALTGSGDRAS